MRINTWTAAELTAYKIGHIEGGGRVMVTPFSIFEAPTADGPWSVTHDRSRIAEVLSEFKRFFGGTSREHVDGPLPKEER